MRFYGDLHVHVARSKGAPIKIATSKNLTVLNILEKSILKGIDIVGIVDAASPLVLEEIKEYVQEGTLFPLEEGGLRYKNKVTLILGCEIEIGKEEKGSPHLTCYFKDIESISLFSQEISKYIKNINLSSQRINLTSVQVVEIAEKYNGVVIPAHVFTPFKSYYGSCTDRLEYVFKDFYQFIYGIELGLSADSDMADQIEELKDKTFLSNSDAHSLEKIAREFNVFDVKEANFEEILLAIKREKGREIIKNYGLNPKLGKYHRTFCLDCGYIAREKPPVKKCLKCGSANIVLGVRDRVEEIKDYDTTHPSFRPLYIYQIPLEFIPNIGKKSIEKLVNYFGSELYALHEAAYEELEKVVGTSNALNILKAREGKLEVSAGGGGIYGKVTIT
ncbi:endonuclease Q family protein [Thermoanaerobacter mathranii]|uniref:endonuclease Q family protein n=1 Tax=Thermoanaerobacter mathranii TaxID=583357 RepID=UPI003D6C0DB1